MFVTPRGLINGLLFLNLPFGRAPSTIDIFDDVVHTIRVLHDTGYFDSELESIAVFNFDGDSSIESEWEIVTPTNSPRLTLAETLIEPFIARDSQGTSFHRVVPTSTCAPPPAAATRALGLREGRNPLGGLRPTRSSGSRLALRGFNASENAIPVNAAGFRCEDSPLVEEAGSRCSVLAKSFGPLGCQRVLSELASERGRTLDNIPAAYRNRRVADACPESCGLCNICSPGCTSWFIGNGWCEPACNTKNCQWDGGDCWETDCIVTNWKRVSECSITCDPASPNGHGGAQTKYREIRVQPTANGKQCPPLEEKIYGCNANVPCPIECEVSHWSEWSQCSHSCGVGTQQRTRQIVRPPQHGAGKCPDFKQTRPCFLTECPVDCRVTDWTEWSECSALCGGGVSYRSRDVDVVPVGVGAICPTLYEEVTCNAQPCEVEQTKCRFSAWTDWSHCSKPCGGGIMFKTREALDGCSASPDETRVERECNTSECVQECVLADWTEWSECNSQCGSGTQERERAVITPPSTMSKPCGVQKETRSCYSRSCPIDCEVSEWSDWSPCNFNHVPGKACGAGTQSRGRTVLTMPSNGGEACPPLMSFRDCFVECPDSNSADICIPSKSRTSEWTSCDEGCFIGEMESNGLVRFPQTPKQYRHQLIEYWGRKCPTDGTEFRNCIDHFCAKPNSDDCLVSAWSSWTPCTVQCGGGGTRSRTRAVLQPPTEVGRPCPPLEQNEECGFADCPVDCETTDWMAWSNCTAPCGAGHQTRHRSVATLANEHPAAKECGPLTQRSPCVNQTAICDVECRVGQWSGWTACEGDCGKGIQRRMRSITTKPVGYHNMCPPLEEIEECDNRPCPQDCVTSEWSPWSDCTAPCLSPTDGMQTRFRSILQESAWGGKPCPPLLQESRRCRGGDDCMKIHCEYSPWSECSARCGRGEIFRDPMPPKPGVDIAVCYEMRQMAPCFLATCPVDCEVSEWSDWSECSAKCNGGEQTRFREIIRPSANGGQICPGLVEWQSCNTQSCAELAREADCKLSEWSEWAPCTFECGGGITARTRSVVRPAAPGGQPCGNLSETRGCNLQRCPGKPCQDNPRFVEEGGKQGITCKILRAQGCSVNLWDLARKHGTELPREVPPEARVQDVCPMTCGVCDECAPGCEVRDLGNTVCTKECDNAACEFDRGDCGGDCLIPSTYTNGGDMILTPPVTALQESQTVSLQCPEGRRFSTLSAFEQLNIECTTGRTNQKELQLISDQWSGLSQFQEDLTSLRCVDDLCPWVLIEGFMDEFHVLDGIYRRNTDVNGPNSAYIRRVGMKMTVHLRADWYGNDRVWRLSYETKNLPEDYVLPDLVSNACPAPSIHGSDLDTDCVESFAALDAREKVIEELPDSVTLRCISAAERLLVKENWKMNPPATVLKNGRFEMNLACEDVALVKHLSGFNCEQLEKALGCDFPLRDAGHELPPILPDDATVGLVCPFTCDQCGRCAPGCAHWALGNGVCDLDCNTPECQFDHADCDDMDAIPPGAPEVEPPSNVPTRMKGEQELHSLLEPICMDDPIVASAGYTCSMIEMLAKSVEGDCFTSVSEIAANQPLLQARLTPDFPKDFRLVDACPKTCGCCDCHGSLLDRRIFVPHLTFLATGQMTTRDTTIMATDSTASLISSTTFNGPCSNADDIIRSTADMTCGDLVWLFKDCSVMLDDLGYLPEGVETNMSIADVCPQACGVCENADIEAWECNDLNAAVQKFSTLTCTAVRAFLSCDTRIANLGMTLPAGLPSSLSVRDLCPRSCDACPSPNTDTSTAVASGGCVDPLWFEDAFGFSCAAAVRRFRDCSIQLKMITDGAILPDTLPMDSSLAEVCPRSCGVCDSGLAACEDQSIVTTTFRTSCANLMAANGCATLLTESSVQRSNLPDDLVGSSVGDVCKKTCGYCGTVIPPSASGGLLAASSTCQDNPTLTQTGWSCALFVNYGSQGCDTPVLQLIGTGHSLPSGLDANSLVREACPRTCNVCRDGEDIGAPAAACVDSPLLSAVGLTCEQVISMAGGSGPGCITEIASIAGSVPVTAILPVGMQVRELCAKSCRVCLEPACDDGFMNGDETGIDCGGSCRPCRTCSSASLKSLPRGMISTAIDGKEDFSHSAKRVLTCAIGFQSSSPSTDTIVCQDGEWSEPASRCEEETIEVWMGTVGLSHGQDFDHNVLPVILDTVIDGFAALRPGLSEDYYRISAGGSCAAMSSTSAGECEDNTLVEQMGFGCRMLAGLGCEQSLSYLAGLQGTPLPPGIPEDALVSDACPVTCDTCEEATARMAEYLATIAGADDPLGTDCLKANLLVKVTVETEELVEELQDALGPKHTMSKHLTTTFKDELSKWPMDIYTNWTASGNIKTRTRQDALAYVTSRPVEVHLQEPSTDSGGFALGGEEDSSVSLSTAAVAKNLVPLERRNVTLTSWKEGLRAGQEGFFSRRVFRLNGIKPSLDTALSRSDVALGLLPSGSERDFTTSTLRGYYFNVGGYGSVLTHLTEVTRDCEKSNNDCCAIMSVIDSFLDSECGALLFAQTPATEDLVQFCRLPEVEEGQLSCLARLRVSLWSFRGSGKSACQAADLATDLFDSACAIDPADGTFCLPKMASDLSGMSLEKFAQQSNDEFNVHCDKDSCMRNHFKFVSAVSTLTAGFSINRLKEEEAAVAADTTDADARLLEQLNWQYQFRRRLHAMDEKVRNKIATRFDALETVRKLVEIKQTIDVSAQGFLKDISNSDISLFDELTPLRRLTETQINREGHFMFPIESYGLKFLDLVCTQAGGVYCQQSLQLLSDADPIAKPDLVGNACSSPCYSTVVRKLGGLIREHGRDLRSPRHLVLGSLMNHYGRWACHQNIQNSLCHSQLTKRPSLSSYNSVFNVTRPAFPVSDCGTCAASFLSDGTCDWDCFTPECGFDGTDCIAWNIYPETFNRYLNAICIRSLNDPCNPLLKTFSCSNSNCKARMKMCFEANGCCYTAALESLRATLQTQKELMTDIWTDWASTNAEAALPDNLTFYDAFNLDRSPAFFELDCGFSLDRSCANGVNYKYHSFAVEIENVRSVDTSGRRLSAQGNTESTLDRWLQTSQARERFADALGVVPSDIARILWKADDIDSSVLQLDIDAGRTTLDTTHIKSTVASNVFDILSGVPEFWQDVVNVTKSPTTTLLHSMSPSGVNLNQAEGAWGLSNFAPTRSAAACSSEALWQLSAKGMVIGHSSELTARSISDGTELSVTCMGSYVGSANAGRLRCDNGVWMNPGGFRCHRPCSGNPLEALGLNSKAVFVQPVADNNLTRLFSHSDLQHQVSVLPGTRYSSGTSMLLTCAQGYSANVTAGSGVDATTCMNGRWTKTSLDCQQSCPEMPSWAEDGGYIITNSEDCRFGAVRTVKCASTYFPVPPSNDANSGVSIQCLRESVWSQPAFRCIQGRTIDPLGGPGTVQKMLNTLFSTTGIASLGIFFGCMILIVIFIMVLWKLFFKAEAQKTYVKQFDMLAHYVAENLGTGGQDNVGARLRRDLLAMRLFKVRGKDDAEATENLIVGEVNNNPEQSPSSSTVSAVRRVAALVHQNASEQSRAVFASADDAEPTLHKPFHSGIVHPQEGAPLNPNSRPLTRGGRANGEDGQGTPTHDVREVNIGGARAYRALDEGRHWSDMPNWGGTSSDDGRDEREDDEEDDEEEGVKHPSSIPPSPERSFRIPLCPGESKNNNILTRPLPSLPPENTSTPSQLRDGRRTEGIPPIPANAPPPAKWHYGPDPSRFQNAPFFPPKLTSDRLNLIPHWYGDDDFRAPPLESTVIRTSDGTVDFTKLKEESPPLPPVVSTTTGEESGGEGYVPYSPQRRGRARGPARTNNASSPAPFAARVQTTRDPVPPEPRVKLESILVALDKNGEPINNSFPLFDSDEFCPSGSYQEVQDGPDDMGSHLSSFVPLQRNSYSGRPVRSNSPPRRRIGASGQILPPFASCTSTCPRRDSPTRRVFGLSTSPKWRRFLGDLKLSSRPVPEGEQQPTPAVKPKIWRRNSAPPLDTKTTVWPTHFPPAEAISVPPADAVRVPKVVSAGRTTPNPAYKLENQLEHILLESEKRRGFDPVGMFTMPVKHDPTLTRKQLPDGTIETNIRVYHARIFMETPYASTEDDSGVRRRRRGPTTQSVRNELVRRRARRMRRMRLERSQAIRQAARRLPEAARIDAVLLETATVQQRSIAEIIDEKLLIDAEQGRTPSTRPPRTPEEEISHTPEREVRRRDDLMEIFKKYKEAREEEAKDDEKKTRKRMEKARKESIRDSEIEHQNWLDSQKAPRETPPESGEATFVGRKPGAQKLAESLSKVKHRRLSSSRQREPDVVVPTRVICEYTEDTVTIPPPMPRVVTDPPTDIANDLAQLVAAERILTVGEVDEQRIRLSLQRPPGAPTNRAIEEIPEMIEASHGELTVSVKGRAEVTDDGAVIPGQQYNTYSRVTGGIVRSLDQLTSGTSRASMAPEDFVREIQQIADIAYRAISDVEETDDLSAVCEGSEEPKDEGRSSSDEEITPDSDAPSIPDEGVSDADYRTRRCDGNSEQTGNNRNNDVHELERLNYSYNLGIGREDSQLSNPLNSTMGIVTGDTLDQLVLRGMDVPPIQLGNVCNPHEYGDDDSEEEMDYEREEALIDLAENGLISHVGEKRERGKREFVINVFQKWGLKK